MRFEIVVEHEPDDEEEPWNAGIFPIRDDGESLDLVASGTGATAQEAALDAVTEWKRVS